MAGIVGLERYQFDIWGDTVNVAARLAGVASPGGVALTEETPRDFPACAVSPRGAVELKGKGSVRMVEVTAMTEDASYEHPRNPASQGMDVGQKAPDLSPLV